MNTEPAPVVPQSERRLLRWLLIGLLAMIIPVIMVAVGVVSMFRLDGDAAALRREVAAATDTVWNSKVQLSAGWCTLTAARTVLHFIEHEHRDEARLALAAVRSASVGVYQRAGRAGPWSHRQLIERTDRLMRQRGWSRLVGVVEPHSTVLVYASDEIADTSRVDLCVAVMDGDDLVVVSTRVDADKLMQLAEMKMPPGGFREKLKHAGI